MKTLVIYDNTGYIILQIVGSGAKEPQGGVQFMWFEIPSNKRLVSINTSVTPHQPVLVDIPPTEIELLQQQLTAANQAIADLSMAIVANNSTTTTT